MSIYKQDYGNVPDVTIVAFGKGSVIMTCSSNKEDVRESLLFKSCEPVPIGSSTGRVNNSDEFEPEVVLTFYNKESFEVFKSYVDKIAEKYGIL